MALYDQLHEIAVAVTISSLCLWRGSFAANQSYILDRVAHAVLEDWIKPVNAGWDHLLVPDQKSAITHRGIKHKTHTDIVAFPLHTIHATSTTAKAHTFGFPNADAIDRLIGSA